MPSARATAARLQACRPACLKRSCRQASRIEGMERTCRLIGLSMHQANHLLLPWNTTCKCREAYGYHLLEDATRGRSGTSGDIRTSLPKKAIRCSLCAPGVRRYKDNRRPLGISLPSSLPSLRTPLLQLPLLSQGGTLGPIL